MDLFKSRGKRFNTEGTEVAHRGHGDAFNLLSGGCSRAGRKASGSKGEPELQLLTFGFEIHLCLRSFGCPYRVASG
jgi:hypothetical protein